MSEFVLSRDDARLHGIDTGGGPRALVFQHGLGGDLSQVAGVIRDTGATRRLTLECRGHGASSPGSRRPFSVALFVDDVVAAADARGVGRFVAGGISMGAAVALAIAVRHPERVRGLVLVRPAWAWEPAPPSLMPFMEMARALRQAPPAQARTLFAASATGRMLAEVAPANLASLLAFFERPDPAVTADLIADIATGSPGYGPADLAALRIPALVIGNGADYAHPLPVAEALAGVIPRARLLVVPAKAAGKAVHRAAVAAAVEAFMETIDG